MNISPISNYNKNTENNKKTHNDVSFKSISKILISPDFFKNSAEISNIDEFVPKFADTVGFMQFIKMLEMKFETKNPFKRIMRTFNMKFSSATSILSETNQLNTFESLNKATNNKLYWRAQQLGISVPKNLNNDYNTLFLFSQGDAFSVNKLFSKSMNIKALVRSAIKTLKQSPEVTDADDLYFIRQMFQAKELDDAIEALKKDKKIDDILINSDSDLRDLYKRIEKRIIY